MKLYRLFVFFAIGFIKMQAYNLDEYKRITLPILMSHFRSAKEGRSFDTFREAHKIESLDGEKYIAIKGSFFLPTKEFENPENEKFNIEHKIAQAFKDKRSESSYFGWFGSLIEDKYYPFDKGTRCTITSKNTGSTSLGYKCTCEIIVPEELYNTKGREYLGEYSQKKEQALLEAKEALSARLKEGNVNLNSPVELGGGFPISVAASSAADICLIKELFKRAILQAKKSNEVVIEDKGDYFEVSFEIPSNRLNPIFSKLPTEDEAKINYGENALPGGSPEDLFFAIQWAHMKATCKKETVGTVVTYGQKIGPNQLFIENNLGSVSGYLSIEKKLYQEIVQEEEK